ncbi:MAG: GNAT family N-acetyltransferase [Marinilabiliaceae bacterium]|nr:GNAT family N-acetyltransferase [Marinilabiliaceae bacterium]
MLVFEKYHCDEDFKTITREEYVNFLFDYLGKFGDPKPDIQKCLDYAFTTEKLAGGFALGAFFEDQLVGALIMNKTGMSGYMPDHVLVYVAVDETHRGKGFGQQIIEKSFTYCNGDVKLHVEYDNPAKRLYERIGFKNKYADMRYVNENTSSQK